MSEPTPLCDTSAVLLHEALAKLHAEVDQAVAPLEAQHSERLVCKRGCHDCCVDALTVFEIEADRIRHAYPKLLDHGDPHPTGACAFLDADGACRVYDVRPYVCRTQGLPLRWTDDDVGAEYRDICALNEPGPPITELDADDCWTLGTYEAQLATLQSHSQGSLQRVALRDLFRAPRAQR